MNFSLPKELQQVALLLADQIVNDRVPLGQVICAMEQDKYCTSIVTNFWATYNKTTKLALKKLITEKYRTHLQNCMDMPSVEHP